MALAALFLAVVAWQLRKPLLWQSNWRHYLFLGLFNSALPFVLFAYAALTLPASLLAILNATAPIWGAALMALRSRQALTPKTIAGLLLGLAGVALLVGLDESLLRKGAAWAILAALGAPLCYGIASTYASRAPKIDAFANAHGSMWAATLLLIPLLPLSPVSSVPTPTVLGSVLALGVICSGIAYLLYFKLIEEVGPAPALTVTFLIPMFGIFWGAWILDETVGWHTLAGSLVVISGTALVTGFSPKLLLKRLPSAN